MASTLSRASAMRGLEGGREVAVRDPREGRQAEGGLPVLEERVHRIASGQVSRADTWPGRASGSRLAVIPFEGDRDAASEGLDHGLVVFGARRRHRDDVGAGRQEVLDVLGVRGDVVGGDRRLRRTDEVDAAGEDSGLGGGAARERAVERELVDVDVDAWPRRIDAADELVGDRGLEIAAQALPVADRLPASDGGEVGFGGNVPRYAGARAASVAQAASSSAAPASNPSDLMSRLLFRCGTPELGRPALACKASVPRRPRVPWP